MKEYPVDNSVETNPPVLPPHFDDEWTLLTARPVVPLEKINAKVRHRRRWFLGGAFALAMMLGAATALVASYLRLRHFQSTAAASEVSQPEVTAEPLAVAESVPAEVPVVEEAQPSPVPTETPKIEVAPRRRAIVRHVEAPPASRDVPKLSEADELNRIRDAVLFDEWQERRARRVMRREQRRLDQYHHRDLSNLDEIFEGRKKPQ